MKRSISYDCDSMTDRLSATEIIIRNSGKGAVPEEQTGLSLFFDFGILFCGVTDDTCRDG